MQSAGYYLFKTLDGAVVGTIGATIVNVSAYLIGVQSVDIGKIAMIMATGSVLFGLARRESTFANSATDTIKHDKAMSVYNFDHRGHENFSQFAESFSVNILGNTLSAVPGFMAYASLALLDVTSPDFKTLAALMLSVTAGSAVETAYQPRAFGR